MRLTLRTLLAYRDGVLSPAAASDLHQRIMHTEVASTLLRRIDTLVQQKQMLAPKAIGVGLGGDANSVAEYLDDTLASEHVAEFERICIAESDLVLAELAHCHRLLAEALNSKVNVPASLKALAVGLVDPANQAALAARLKPTRSVSVSKHAVVPTAKTDGELRRLERGNDGSLVNAVEVTAAEAGTAKVPAVAVPVALSSVDVVSAEAVLEGGQPAGHSSIKAMNASALAIQSPVTAPLESIGGAAAKPMLEKISVPVAHQVPEYLVGQSGGSWRMPAAIAALSALLAVLVWQSLGPLSNVQNLFGTNSLVNPASSGDAVPTSADIADVKDVTEQLTPEGRLDASVASAVKNASGKVAVGANAVAKPLVEVDNANELTQPLTVPKSTDPEVNGEKQVVAPESGSLQSPPGETLPVRGSLRWVPSNITEGDSVLLVRSKAEDGTGGLSRLERGTGIPDGAEIIVPPLMRPTLDVAGVCSWTVCGPTRMQLKHDPAENQTIISTSLCRAIARAAGEPSAITVSSPAGEIEVAFADAKSMASIEVVHRRVALGELTDPAAFKPVAIVVAVEGQVAVKIKTLNGESQGLKLAVGEGAALVDGQLVEFELVSIPVWYRTSVERPLDTLAAADLHLLLNTEEATQLQLKVLCMDRRPETAALAIQTSVMLGDWSGFVQNLLSNEQMRSHWGKTLELAEQCVVSEPTGVEALGQELKDVYAEASVPLLELFVGRVTADGGEQIQEVLLPKLVDSLGSERIEERVLAAYQLKRLTGKDLGFQPSVPNRAALQLWRRELAKNANSLILPIGDPVWEAKQTMASE